MEAREDVRRHIAAMGRYLAALESRKAHVCDSVLMDATWSGRSLSALVTPVFVPEGDIRDAQVVQKGEIGSVAVLAVDRHY